MSISEIQKVSISVETRNRNSRIGSRAGGGEAVDARRDWRLGFECIDGERNTRSCCGRLDCGEMVTQSPAPAADGYARLGTLVRRQSEIDRVPSIAPGCPAFN